MTGFCITLNHFENFSAKLVLFFLTFLLNSVVIKQFSQSKKRYDFSRYEVFSITATLWFITLDPSNGWTSVNEHLTATMVIEGSYGDGNTGAMVKIGATA